MEEEFSSRDSPEEVTRLKHLSKIASDESNANNWDHMD